MDEIISICDLSFRYGGETKVLDGVDLSIRRGEFVLLGGPSGSGKSTLLKCLNGIIPHFYCGTMQGEITVDGRHVRPPSEMSEIIATLTQDPDSMLLSTTVAKEIAISAHSQNNAPETLTYVPDLSDLCAMLGISNLLDRNISDLSGGQRQKVALACAILQGSKILVLDEPFSELDRHSIGALISLLIRLNKAGMTIIVAEQRREIVAPYITREIVLEGGKVAYDGKPANKTFQINKKSHKIGDALIELSNLSLSYPGGHQTLDGISARFYEGEIVHIAGGNGAGKTTFLKLLMGLRTPDSGTINIGGIINPKVEDLAGEVGYVYQNPSHQIFLDTVWGEVDFILKNTGKSGDPLDIMRCFGLEEYARSCPADLSGGERQRVALASVLVAQPKVLLLDEPTRGMDHDLKAHLASYLQDYALRGNLVILATHDDYMARCATRKITLDYTDY